VTGAVQLVVYSLTHNTLAKGIKLVDSKPEKINTDHSHTTCEQAVIHYTGLMKLQTLQELQGSARTRHDFVRNVDLNPAYVTPSYI
jgi:hypothetical protein